MPHAPGDQLDGSINVEVVRRGIRACFRRCGHDVIVHWALPFRDKGCVKCGAGVSAPASCALCWGWSRGCKTQRHDIGAGRRLPKQSCNVIRDSIGGLQQHGVGMVSIPHVTEIFLCPSNAAIVSSEKPRSAATEAKECRNVCGVMSGGNPDADAMRAQALGNPRIGFPDMENASSLRCGNPRSTLHAACDKWPHRSAGLCVPKTRSPCNEVGLGPSEGEHFAAPPAGEGEEFYGRRSDHLLFR
jgi:hypothetical protein